MSVQEKKGEPFMKFRTIDKILQSKMTTEGAGVLLHRVFGFDELGLLDPFLLLDHFGSDNPDDYTAGFPWHPHRGIETITYMVEGVVEHGDSIGNKGIISSGDIQWMSAGSGIIHQEMPKPYRGTMRGFQLWVNIPSADKMKAPDYQEFSAEKIPVVDAGSNIKVKVVAGEFCEIKGPVSDPLIDPFYFDVSVPAKTGFRTMVNPGHTVFAFVFEGAGTFDESKSTLVSAGQLVKLADGDTIEVYTPDKSVRFLLVAGKPLNQPVAWRGPIVMNTQEELVTAFREFREGTFVK
jgi:redox-sensitive bicupin YhaK (pirin superfamily)